ncbi:hypothetical protein TraAM80_08684, partial [Trypanosoma rangeli]
MSVDPLALVSDDQRELQRLLKENRELRQANAQLRVSVETKTSRGNGGSGGVKDAAAAEKGRDSAGPSGESVGGNIPSTAVSVRRLKDELRHSKEALEEARREQAAAREEYKRIKSLFEAFVVEACEREEACRHVFARVYEEVEEQQRLCEGLQQQLQERPPPALVAPVVAGVDPASLFSLVDSLRASLGELEHRLGYSGDTGSRHTAPAAGGGAPRVARRAKAPPTPEAGATRGGGGGGSPRSHQQQQGGGIHQPQPLSQGPDGAVRLVLPAPGAGALRAATVISGA